MPYAKIGFATERYGKVAVRLDLCLSEGDYRYDDSRFYVIDTASTEYKAGYPGEVDEEGNPVDQQDYQAWRDSLPHKWAEHRVFHHHFVYLEPDDDIQGLRDTVTDAIKHHLPNFYQAWYEEWDQVAGGMRHGWDVATRKRPQRHHKDADYETRKALCEAKADDLKKSDLSIQSTSEGETFPSTDIDVGDPTSSYTGYGYANTTNVPMYNPANDDGVIDTVDLNMEDAGSCDVGLLYQVSGYTYKTRDRVNVGNQSAGYNTNTGLDLDVATGDLIGVATDSTGRIEGSNVSGRDNLWMNGNGLDTVGEQNTYGFNEGYSTAVYGTGETLGPTPVYGAATLAGTGSVSATGSLIAGGSSTLAGTGSVSATGSLIAGGSATLAGTGSVSATALRLRSAAATLAGVGTLSATASAIRNGAATLAGAGSLSAAGKVVTGVWGQASLAGVGTLSATASVTWTASASLAGTGTVSTAGYVRVKPEAQALAPDNVTVSSARLRGQVVDDTGQACEGRFRWKKPADSWDDVGLVGWWKLNEDPAIHGATIVDASGNGNHGTLTTNDGSTDKSVEGKIGRAIEFDGVDDYVKIVENMTEGATRLSVFAWLKRAAGGDTFKVVVHKNTSYTIGGSEYWLGVSNDGYLTATIGAGDGVGWMAGATSITAALDTWYHVGATWDGSTVRVYVDGAEQLSYELLSLTNLDAATRFGCSTDGEDYQYSGLADDTRIYNRALSEAEVQAIYNDGQGTEEGVTYTPWAGSLNTDDIFTATLPYLDPDTQYEFQAQLRHIADTDNTGEWSSALSFTTLAITYGSSALSGVGTLSADALKYLYGEGAIAGVGELTALGHSFDFGAATLAGDGALSSDGKLIAGGSATLAGVGSFSAEGFVGIIASATLAGVGSLQAVGLLVVQISRDFYRVEVRDTDGNLVAILHNAYEIGYDRRLNEPHALRFSLPADDDKTAHLTYGNELWLRDVKSNEVARKFRMMTQRDRR